MSNAWQYNMISYSDRDTAGSKDVYFHHLDNYCISMIDSHMYWLCRIQEMNNKTR